MKVNTSALPMTVNTLKQGFVQAGVKPGMTMLVHTSLKAMNRWIAGGPPAVVMALEEALGEEGTLVMPTHTNDLSEPSYWSRPPVPEEWWPIIREEMAPFQEDLTPAERMGATAECFRKQNGVLRSSHPQLSFAARGKNAAFITEHHALHHSLGEQSPLARLYDADGWVMLLGVGFENCTALHLSELRAAYASKAYVKQGAPCLVDGMRQWVRFDDLDYNSDDFEAIGEAFEREMDLVRFCLIGDAKVRLMPVRPLVDFGVRWMERNR
ncbi:aminoglycoside N(3)-acetyltransferase [Paenibacillus nanensis]|uniref:Aminoglycoside N(3)-acetyltransferase n=1 Tax=Paenibacillus nanensis TaxID=393251 RepID=A0A3A1UML1_9BACL|nr:AAC(3) family N-acetyltransferase [Paenibacillus nanensis]RIX49328.1 aminoglycoside N(3)-acetyltransferase [Paenibacillus nanensis]